MLEQVTLCRGIAALSTSAITIARRLRHTGDTTGGNTGDKAALTSISDRKGDTRLIISLIVVIGLSCRRVAPCLRS